ncbi:hypothetical protein AB0M12_13050 [Nocardia vinacea]|uniref:hypothetical protein n=1 Tax=Nocardia vinacea TaxID=96468 RepID=UPI00342642A6
MSTRDTRTGAFEPLDAELLVLDRDLEQLFAEVEQILCEALARMPAAPRPLVPVPGCGHQLARCYRNTSSDCGAVAPALDGPPSVDLPPRRGTSRNRTAQPEESEVMPVTDSGNDRRGGDEVPTPTRRIRER